MDTVLSKFSVNVLNISKSVCGRQDARRGGIVEVGGWREGH